MTVLDFIRQHPAQTVDVLASGSFQLLTPERSMALAQEQPGDGDLLEMEVSYASFSGGVWHVLASEPEMGQVEQGPGLAMA